MFDAEAQEVEADCTQRARRGFDFMFTEFPGWFLKTPVDDILPGYSMGCPYAWAGKPEGKDFHAVLDDLRVKYPGRITNQWLYDHGFVDDTWVRSPGPGPRYGYALLTDAWRELVSYAQVVYG